MQRFLFKPSKTFHISRTEKDEKKSILKEGYEHLSPIWGFLALKTGMIENLRFFGNYKFGWG